MRVKVCYSEIALQKTVEFISANNKFFLGKDTEIKNSLLQAIRHLTREFPDGRFYGTMGYTLTAEVLEQESMDGDENVLYVDFLVDPALGAKDLNDQELEKDNFEEIVYI